VPTRHRLLLLLGRGCRVAGGQTKPRRGSPRRSLPSLMSLPLPRRRRVRAAGHWGPQRQQQAETCARQGAGGVQDCAGAPLTWGAPGPGHWAGPAFCPGLLALLAGCACSWWWFATSAAAGCLSGSLEGCRIARVRLQPASQPASSRSGGGGRTAGGARRGALFSILPAYPRACTPPWRRCLRAAPTPWRWPPPARPSSGAAPALGAWAWRGTRTATARWSARCRGGARGGAS
jgi:hypothetical protein